MIRTTVASANTSNSLSARSTGHTQQSVDLRSTTCTKASRSTNWLAFADRYDPHYRREREHLEQLVGEINGAYSTVGRPAIHYLYQSVEVDELVALYLAADIMLVTPLRDGMNVVAKEYVACRVDNTGALVLSEFAGAAQELRDAILVNPDRKSTRLNSS